MELANFRLDPETHLALDQAKLDRGLEKISIQLNNQELTATRVSDQWLQCDLLSDVVQAGENVIQVRNRSDENPLSWLDAELKVIPVSDR